MATINIKNNFGKVLNIGTIPQGHSVSITNGKVYIDGIPQDDYEKRNNTKIEVHITIQGTCERIENADYVKVEGSVGSISTMSGDVTCNMVEGSVATMSGDVHATNIIGDVSTMSGDIIKCNPI